MGEISENKQLGDSELPRTTSHFDSRFQSICCDILLFIFACLKQEDEELKESAFRLNTILQNEITQFIVGPSGLHNDEITEHTLTKNSTITTSDNFEALFEEISSMIQDNTD